ncbi:MAG TPA: 2-oxoglutarate oxidoreductase, partial [Candidatus Scatomorpha pullistercoris]|nr:2-oxoglutarate oxidoreductase [Candidatus Scatomorpha pullistercoris]
NSPANIRKAKESILTAFRYQLEGRAFSFVELLTNCPTNWGMSPLDTLKFMEENTIPAFPLGVFRDIGKGV